MSERPGVGGRAVARNAGLNLFGQILPLAAAAAGMPFLARGLGADRLGILSLAWAVLTYFGDIGFGRATTKLVAEVLGRGETERVAPVTWATVLVQLLLGTLGGLLLAAAAPALAGRLVHAPGHLLDQTRLSFYVLAAGVPVLMTASAFRGVLEAAQRFVTINAIRVPVAVASFLLPLIGLAFGLDLAGIMVLLVLGRTVSLCAYATAAIRAFPGIGRSLRIERAELPEVFRFGSWITVSSVVSPVLVYLDRFLLGALVTVVAVAHYTPPLEITTRLLIIPGSIFSTLFPAVSTLASRREDQRMARMVARSIKYVLLGIGPVLVLLAAASRDVLQLWLGAEYAADGWLPLQILAVGTLVNGVAYIPAALLQGVGRADITARFHLLELPLHVVAAYLLIQAFGIAGAALAWTLRVSLDTALLLLAATRVTPLSARTLAAERVPHVGLLLVALGLCAALADHGIGSVALRAAAFLALALCFAPLLWRYGLGAEDREQVRGLVPVRFR